MRKKMSSLYILEEFRQQLMKEAKEKGLSLNAYINMILAERKK